MRTLVRSIPPVIALAAGLCFAAPFALAQDSEHDWQKDYPVTGQPSLTIETADSNLEIHSCGDCKSLRIRVHSDDNLSRYRLEESQSQNHVSFSLKDKPGMGFHLNFRMHEGTRVTVEAPGALELEAKTADGNLSARGLSGTLRLQSSDGNADIEDVHGSLRVNSADGNITIHNSAGTLEARSSDGHIKVDGQFTGVQVRTSDGDLDFALAPGSQLTAASRIESSDGHVRIRVPRDLAADVDVSTSDGHLDCSLPLTMDHYDSRESGGHRLHGRLNAGGTALNVRTADGNVTISTL